MNLDNYYISISSTYQKDEPKNYTFNFKKIKVTNLEEVGKLANSNSISAPTYKDGNRNSTNVLEGGKFILIDCDKPEQSRTVEEKLRPYSYVKVPSRSYFEKQAIYKWHFIVPVQTTLSIYPAAMEYQVRMFFSQIGILDENIDTTVSFDIVRQFAPAEAGLGVVSQIANESMEINDTDLFAPLHPVPKELENYSKVAYKPKRKVPEQENANFNNLESTLNNAGFLDRSKCIYFMGKAITLDDAEKIVYEAIEDEESGIIGGFGCPVCNKEHSSDVNKAYSFAYINTKTTDVTFKCTGNECSSHPYYTLATTVPKKITWTEIKITNEDVAEANKFKTRWETKLNNTSSTRLEENWKQNAAAFRTVIERNKENSSPVKIVSPSPTGSGKTQQIIQKAIELQDTNTRTLIVTLRTGDADIIASEIAEKTNNEYVQVFHTGDITIENVKKASSPHSVKCLIITHEMFKQKAYKDERFTTSREFIVIDEQISAISQYFILLDDLKNMLTILSKIDINKGEEFIKSEKVIRGIYTNLLNSIEGYGKGRDFIGIAKEANKHLAIKSTDFTDILKFFGERKIRNPIK